MRETLHPKNIRELNLVFRLRLLLTMIVFILLIALLAWRMAHIQVINYEDNFAKSNLNKTDKSHIPPVRGKIYDRSGEILAANKVRLSLGIVREHSKNIDELIKKISSFVHIEPGDIDKFKREFRFRKAREATILKSNITGDEAAELEARSYHLPGIKIIARHDRIYNYPLSFSHVVGYVGKADNTDLASLKNNDEYMPDDSVGKSGVEKYYERILRGQSGRKYVEIDAHGKTLRTLSVTPPVAGADLFLSIDISLQEYSYRLLQGRRGAIAAIDPKTSEVLALVSSPGFDGNLFVNGISHLEFNILRSSRERSLFNRAISGNYPPASTFKPFIALAGLENDVVSPDKEIVCHGHYTLSNSKHKFRDWKKWGHGKTRLNKAIVESCDVYFFDLAFNLGIDRINPFMARFGFGKKTGVDLPFESAGFMPARTNKSPGGKAPWTPGDTLNVGVGQGAVAVTPLQLAQAAAILANDGKGSSPRVVNRIQGPNKTRQNGARSKKKKHEIPTRKYTNWKTVKKAMIDVIHSPKGTARAISEELAYAIAGKTGTAQVFTIRQNEEYDRENIEERLKDHALFIAYAPAEKPEIALAVIIENAGPGSAVAAPIARKIMDKYLLDMKT